MRIAHFDQSKLHDAKNCHSGAGILRYMGLLDSNDFETPWMFIHRGILMPKSGIGYHAHDNCEEMFVIFDNTARFTHNGNTAEFKGGAMVPCRMGEVHGIYNHTDRPTQWMNLGVAGTTGDYDCRDFKNDLVDAEPKNADKVPVGWIDRSLLNDGVAAHGGKGKLSFRRIWSHESFKSNWGFVDHVVIPPGCSIGYHRHDTIEECYIIVSGKGRMTVDDETEEVVAWDATPNKLGSAHGIYNHTDKDLEILNMAVSMEKGKFDSTDLDDDLSNR